MGKKHLFISAGMFVVLVFGIVFYLSLTDQPLPTNVKVSYTPPVEAPASPLVNSASREVTEATPPASVSPSQEGFVLHIQDAMGEPIASGTISAGTKDYKFTKGLISINDFQTANAPITVNAEGYSPVEKIINPDDVSTHTITMEYVSSFELCVSLIDDCTVTQSYSIRLWKGESAERPLRDAATVLTTQIGASYNVTHFGLQQNACRVTQGLILFSPSDQIFGKGKEEGVAITGDLLLNLGNCPWTLNSMPEYDIVNRSGFDWKVKNFRPIRKAQSSKLRIWDTLCLSEQKEINSTNLSHEKCEVRCESGTGFYFLAFPELPPDQQVFREFKTDNNGKCRIDNLPPALYYVQAYNENQTSLVIPLHPACGGANLRVENSSRVSVWVKREGLEYKDQKLAFLDGSEVLLRALKPKTGFYSAVTKEGNVTFQNVPYGQYHLTVNPYDGNRYEKDVLIQKPEERFNVSISGWEKFVLNGILIDAETEKPIPNYELILNALHNVEIVKTDNDGRFSFPDLQVGIYRINVDLTRMENFTYMPERCLFTKRDRFIPIRHITIPDDNPDNKTVVIKLHKALETRFSGKVMTKDQKPVAGASIFISFQDSIFARSKSRLYTVPANPVTDQNGSFSIAITGSQWESERNFSFEIVAILGMQTPDFVTENKFWEAIGGYVNANNLGSVSVEGKPGQSFDNLKIVLSGKNDCTLYGRLIVEEENFNDVYVSVQQNTFKMGAAADASGNFTISNLASGDFELRVEPPWTTEIETPYDFKNPKKYLDEKLKLRMPDNQKEMYVDINLRRNGYLLGWAGIAGGDPFRFATVEAEKENKEKVIHIDSVRTNHKGFFFMEGLSFNEFYRFLFYDRESHKMIYRSEPINSEIGEVTFQVKL